MRQIRIPAGADLFTVSVALKTRARKAIKHINDRVQRIVAGNPRERLPSANDKSGFGVGLNQAIIKLHGFRATMRGRRGPSSGSR